MRIANVLCAGWTHTHTHMRTQTCTHTHTAPGAKRAKQTEIVNSAFVKTTGGRWITNPGAPCFQEVKYRKEEEWASEEQGGGARALCGIAMRNQHAKYIITHYWACSAVSPMFGV